MTSAITRTEALDGWTLGFAGEGDEPRVRDLDLAARLGFSRPTKIRDLIRRLSKAGKLNDTDVVTTAVPGFGGRFAEEFWLSEADALYVAAKSETAEADKVLRGIINVFLAWRRGHLTPSASTIAPASIINALAACNLTVGDNSGAAADLKSKIGLYARSAHISFQRAHGRVKRDFRVPSYRYLSLIHYPLAREQLIALAEHPEMAPALAASAATNQLNLFASLAKGKA